MINDCLFITNNYDAKNELKRVAGEISPKSDFCPNFADKITPSLTVDGKKDDLSSKISHTIYSEKIGNGTILSVNFKNETDEPVIISHIELTADLTDELKSLKSPRFFCWSYWDMSVIKISDGNFHSDNILHISSCEGKTIFAGFLTLSRAFLNHSLKVENGKYIWSATMNIGNFHLPAGENFNSEILYIGGYNNPYTALENWAENINKIYKPQVNLKPTVCYNAGGMRPDSEIYEDVILDNLDIINDKMNGLGIEYVWTSQTNLKDFIPGNWLKDNLQEIPSGLEGLTKKMADKGYIIKSSEGKYQIPARMPNGVQKMIKIKNIYLNETP